jgi:hypothetical protein
MKNMALLRRYLERDRALSARLIEGEAVRSLNSRAAALGPHS